MRMRGASEGGRSMKYSKIPSPVKIQSVLIGYEAFSYTVGSVYHKVLNRTRLPVVMLLNQFAPARPPS